MKVTRPDRKQGLVALVAVVREARDADAPLPRGRVAPDEDAVLVEDDAGIREVVEAARRQYEELQELRESIERRLLIERAKGILMARHAVREDRALELLRRQARNTGRRIEEIAAAVTDAHVLLDERAAAPAPVPARRRMPVAHTLSVTAAATDG